MLADTPQPHSRRDFIGRVGQLGIAAALPAVASGQFRNLETVRRYHRRVGRLATGTSLGSMA